MHSVCWTQIWCLCDCWGLGYNVVQSARNRLRNSNSLPWAGHSTCSCPIGGAGWVGACPCLSCAPLRNSDCYLLSLYVSLLCTLTSVTTMCACGAAKMAWRSQALASLPPSVIPGVLEPEGGVIGGFSLFEVIWDLALWMEVEISLLIRQ